MKKITPIMFALCLLFTACGKEQQSEWPPLDYNYSGRVYASPLSFGSVDVYDFVSSDSVCLSHHRDSWDGELSVDQISHRGYCFEYQGGIPTIVMKWTKKYTGDTLSVSYEIIDDEHFRSYLLYWSDEVFSRVK